MNRKREKSRKCYTGWENIKQGRRKSAYYIQPIILSAHDQLNRFMTSLVKSKE
jgi:hypothetical protein